MKFRVVDILIITVVGLLISCTDKVTNNNLPSHPNKSATAIYVALNSEGDGSFDNPLGSIQEALDLAAMAEDIDTIYIASGLYNQGCLEIISSVVLLGSRDPENGWELSVTDSTRILTGLIEGSGYAIGFRIIGVDSLVKLNNLVIRSITALHAGSSAYSIYCLNSNNIRINHCVIFVGHGADGANGIDGFNGMNGDDAESMAGGQNFAAGGDGGWYSDDPFELPEPGEQGYCCDGSQTGGEGGGDGNPSTGGDGQDGNSGANGIGGGSIFSFIDSGDFVLAYVENGQDGTDGECGCGGGGGSGTGPTFGHTGWEPGGIGGGGGAGGEGGFGSKGGQSGGHSIAVFCYNSNVEVNSCFIRTFNGGKGGNGGVGGIGGTGGLGAGGIQVARIPGGDGGNGGSGGNGGHGGGGAGGSSIGIFAYNSSVEYNDCLFDIGDLGEGGNSPGNNGEDGLSKTFYTIDR